MKKKGVIIIVIIIVVLLLIPFPLQARDGGTRIYNAILYKVVVWHRIDETQPGGYKTGIEVHFIPNNFNDLSEYD